jgi:hypothetical protein
MVKFHDLVIYTSGHGHYSKMNGYLRGTNSILTAQERMALDEIADIFEQAPVLEESIILYRGNSRNVMDNKAYISTSSDPEIAMQFTRNDCCFYTITVSAGCKAIPLVTISEHPDESEYLLDKGGQYVVTTSRIDKGILHIYVTLLPPQAYTIVPNVVQIEREIHNEKIVSLTREGLNDALENGIIDEITRDDIIEELKSNFQFYYERNPNKEELEKLFQMYL